MGIGKGILAVIGAVALVTILIVAVFAYRYFSAPARGAIEAREEIQSGDARIQAYNTFFNLCAAIQAAELLIDTTKAQLALVPTDDRKEVNRLNSNLTGVQGQRQRNITQYNADAAKDYTVGQFRDSDLPYKINIQGPTKCARN